MDQLMDQCMYIIYIYILYIIYMDIYIWVVHCCLSIDIWLVNGCCSYSSLNTQVNDLG